MVIYLQPSERPIPPRREAVDIDLNTIIHKTEDGEFLILGKNFIRNIVSLFK